MSLHPVIQQRAETLARIVYHSNPAMQGALRSAVEALCTLAWCHGYSEACTAAKADALPPTSEVELLADLAIKKAAQG
jgi:hypothetical protein